MCSGRTTREQSGSSDRDGLGWERKRFLLCFLLIIHRIRHGGRLFPLHNGLEESVQLRSPLWDLAAGQWMKGGLDVQVGLLRCASSLGSRYHFNWAVIRAGRLLSEGRAVTEMAHKAFDSMFSTYASLGRLKANRSPLLFHINSIFHSGNFS